MALLDFLQGEDSATTRAQVHSLVYDCSRWQWANVLGGEMFVWQMQTDWQGDIIFCHLSQSWKRVFNLLMPPSAETPPAFRSALYFDTLEEGLIYVQGHSS